MSEILSANRLTDALAEIEKFVLASDEAGLGAASRSWALPGFLKGEMKRIACDLIRFAPDAHREGRFLAFSGVDKTGKGTHLFNISNKAGVVSVISHLREKGFHTLGITQPSYGSLMGGWSRPTWGRETRASESTARYRAGTPGCSGAWTGPSTTTGYFPGSAGGR